MASAISGYINTLRNSKYGGQVRDAIIGAITQCYTDVNAPSLILDGIRTIIDEYLDDGTISSQIVSSVSYTKSEIDTMMSNIDVGLTAAQKAALIALLD